MRVVNKLQNPQLAKKVLDVIKSKFPHTNSKKLYVMDCRGVNSTEVEKREMFQYAFDNPETVNKKYPFDGICFFNSSKQYTYNLKTNHLEVHNLKTNKFEEVHTNIFKS